MLPLVLIIGRANVGKSALFNAIVGKRQALISKIPGTTRDMNLAEVRWKKIAFTLGDSAGLEDLHEVEKHLTGRSDTPIHRYIDISKYKNAESLPLDRRIQIKVIEHLLASSILILVVDADTGIMPQDRQIIKFLKKHGLSFILTVNKVDGKNDESKAEEFLKLNMKPTFLVSSITRRGIGDLLDYISQSLPTTLYPLPTKKTIRVAIIGKTNVGKSTLTNTLIGSEEMMVSASPHTTREPHAKLVPLDENYHIELVDTAGIRKKAKIEHFLEIAGVRMSLERLKQAGVVLFVIDMSENLTSQDLALARIIAEHRRSCIIVGNKWDLVKQIRDPKSEISPSLSARRAGGRNKSQIQNSKFKNNNMSLRDLAKQSPNHAVEFEKYIRANLPKLSYAPLLFVSAKEGVSVASLKPLIKQVYENTYRIFSEHEVNVVLQKSLKLQPPPIVGEKKRKVQVKGLYQNSKNPKEFILKVYTRDYVPQNFVKFIEKQLRYSLPLEGVAMYITVENIREG